MQPKPQQSAPSACEIQWTCRLEGIQGADTLSTADDGVQERFG